VSVPAVPSNPTPAAESPSRWLVLKFGGTSVSTQARWENIAAIVRERRQGGAQVLVVVSALSGVTNALQALIEQARAGQSIVEDAAALVERHRRFATELGIADDTALDHWLERLAALAAVPRPDEYVWHAEMLACGELLSSTLGAAFLTRLGLATHWLDARDALHAMELPNQSPWARRLSVSCRSARDPALVARLASADAWITQGFIARAVDGRTAILGRGGSDTSAAYFGALLGAERVEIWTDVAGMFSANPRAVPGARLLKRLDYEEAQEIATTGAKVLHPRCLTPVREARVPLWIKDTNRPELAGTEIGASAASSLASVKALSVRTGITLVSMETVGMWQQVGFLADVFAEFKRHGLSIDLIGSAETNVTVSLDPTENLVDSDVLGALCNDLARVCRVKVIAPCAAVTLVGRGMRSLLHKLAPVLAEFGSQRVHLISQSSNDLNLTFVVDEQVAAAMLPRLHELVVATQAMRLDDEAVFGPAWDSLYGAAAGGARVRPWWSRRRSDLLAAAREASPRYAYDLEEVEAAAARLTSLPVVDRWHYALKANPHPALLRTLVAAGFELECVSQGELEHALAHVPGLAPERILFTPNFAPRAEYERALALGARVTLDGLHPIVQWPEVFGDREIVLRLDLGYGRGHHAKVVTGGAGSKFGLPLVDLARFRSACEAAGARVVALHAHLGSGIVDADHWRSVYAELATLADPFPHCVALDIGGGLGLPARPGAPTLDLDALGRMLSEVKSLYPQYALWMEPGRYPVAEAGVLLARVTQVKRKAGIAYVGIDAGMNSLLRPALYGAHHEIVNLTRLDATCDTLTTVVGPICESGDVLGEDRLMPEAFEGDVLLVAQAGAYGHVMASRYNLREPAGELILDDRANESTDEAPPPPTAPVGPLSPVGRGLG